MKEKIRKALIAVNAIIFILAGCALDSESLIPMYTMFVTGAVLMVYALQHRWTGGAYEDN